ncbi:claudin-3 isoform 1-T2 [Menidia menidia]|uniref:(Atlantic silverside) hypothetical protein n=1 Tax=Menidia menidia TaxID=238744 RepID=A0A8S4AK75_9TELE|nr:unnamed protein product [Menidia menidia]
MIYLAHTAHWQFLGLVTGIVAWILTMAAVGLNEWRLWQVDGVPVIASGEAWVGIWRACFHSHAFPAAEQCRAIGLSDAFAPPEIPAAQVLMMLALVCGLAGNVSAGAAVRMAYFSLENRGNVRLAFVLAGALYLLTAALSLVPLAWNMNSVLNNSTIDFPPEFHFPAAPVRQRVGSAIGVGIFASLLMLISGNLFLCYWCAWKGPEQTKDPLHGPWTVTTLPQNWDLARGESQGRDNPTFHSQEIS